jgi:carbamate kinase
VVVHGNGPQVGNLALQQEATAMVPAQPLALLTAMTQGELGSLIVSAINALRGPGTAVALVTHVTVSSDLGPPVKPIGPFFTQDDAQRLAAARGWAVAPDSGRGFRRVVPSPEPASIVEVGAVRALVEAGHVVVACGGGGIPVTGAAGADAVIDKDRAASLLARLLGAQALLIVTAIDRVMLNYGTPQATELDTITAAQARDYLATGHFPAGSMGPKIEAALAFLAAGGEWAAITSPGLVAATVSGGPGAGTRIERSLEPEPQAI